MTRVTEEQVATARGGVLGLMLGDAIGATVATWCRASGTLRATSAGRLACFTVDGLNRAHVRLTHILPTADQVWHAYMRWAAMLGISGIEPWLDHDWDRLRRCQPWPRGGGRRRQRLRRYRGGPPAAAQVGWHEHRRARVDPSGGAVDAAALGSTLIRLLGEGRTRLPQRSVNLMAD